jgi:TolB-like protein
MRQTKSCSLQFLDSLTSTRLESKEVQAELDRILASPLFAHAMRQRRFLKFVVGETIEGRAHKITGYSVGIRVFDRDSGFDPLLDPVVRVGAVRLRAKLREYYDDEGRSDPICIGLSKGSYAPTIRERSRDDGRLDRERGVFDVSAEKPSLIVFPFASNGNIPGHERFADGLTEDLITGLSKLPCLSLALRYMSQASFKGVLQPEYFLEGSVRHAGERVRVSTKLVNAVSSQILLAMRYDRKLGDDFAVQEELSRNIVRAVRLKLNQADNFTNRIGASISSVTSASGFKTEKAPVNSNRA